jgi:DNA-3-methyladenine glycosylase II
MPYPFGHKHNAVAVCFAFLVCSAFLQYGLAQFCAMGRFDAENFTAGCKALCSKDPAFEAIVQQFGFPPLWQRPPGFASLLHIILEQQVSLQSARAAFDQLQTLLGSVTPEAFLQLSPDPLKACYFSRQKMGYAQGLAWAVVQGELDLAALEAAEDAEVFARLTQVKGIGPWTACIYMMMCLNRIDVFPAGDVALLSSARQVFSTPGAALSYPQLLSMSQAWAPYRTLAAYLLWHAYLSKKQPLLAAAALG